MKISIAIAIILSVCGTLVYAQQSTSFSGMPQQPTGAEKVVIKAEKGNVYYLKVYDVTGKEVLKKELESTVENGLSTCELKKGVYSYIVSDKNGKVIKKGAFEVQF